MGMLGSLAGGSPVNSLMGTIGCFANVASQFTLKLGGKLADLGSGVTDTVAARGTAAADAAPALGGAVSRLPGLYQAGTNAMPEVWEPKVQAKIVAPHPDQVASWLGTNGPDQVAYIGAKLGPR